MGLGAESSDPGLQTSGFGPGTSISCELQCVHPVRRPVHRGQLPHAHWPVLPRPDVARHERRLRERSQLGGEDREHRGHDPAGRRSLNRSPVYLEARRRPAFRTLTSSARSSRSTSSWEASSSSSLTAHANFTCAGWVRSNCTFHTSPTASGTVVC